MPHLPTPETIARWPVFTAASPLRAVVSGCLAGRACGVDHSTLGLVLRHLGRPDLAPSADRDHHENDWYVQQFGKSWARRGLSSGKAVANKARS